MANLPATLVFTPSNQSQGSIANAGTAGGAARETLAWGANGFPPDTPPVTQAAAANGTYQCQQWYQGQYTVASGANQDIDFTSLTNGIGGAVDFSAGGTGLKYLYVAILSPDGGATKQLKVGPQAQGNAFVGPFDANTDSLLVNSRCRLIDCVESAVGFTVDSTHKMMRFHNNGSASLTIQLFVMG